MNRHKLVFSMLPLFIAVTMASSALDDDRECEEVPPMAAFVTHVEGETYTCLDSYTQGASTRAIFTANKDWDAQAIIVLDVETVGDAGAEHQIKSQTRVAGEQILPNGCGSYLKGARVLPGSTKIATIYAAGVIRSVDLQDAAHPVIATLYDDRVPGRASTCEGYMPNWGAGREDLTVDADKKTISQIVHERVPVERVQEKPVSPAQAAFYARAYAEECGAGSPVAKSASCLDLKEARDRGIYRIRYLENPTRTVTVGYGG